MSRHRCAAHCACGPAVSRRQFAVTASASVLAGSLWSHGLLRAESAASGQIKPRGPAARCVPTVKACFVRRAGDYGMRWPGQIYDGQAALTRYSELVRGAGQQLGMRIDLCATPIYTPAEADQWLGEATAAKPDGLLVVLLDRQEHAWPTAVKAIDTQIPTVVFSPIGSSFTTNTVDVAHKTGCFICSTDDFRQVQYGLKMIHAAAKMRATRCLVIAGTESSDAEIADLGIQLRYLPAHAFLEAYEKTPVTDDVVAMANQIVTHAKQMIGATPQDVINGVKSYRVACQLMEQAEADAITMDCLGALGATTVSLPCIAWSQMNDDGIPAACEADLGAVATHILVQYLFDRPGFQQDPVAETTRDAIIGAHCSCPTRLSGFAASPEPYDVVHHHGVRDATRRPAWKLGQRMTSADVLLRTEGTPTQMIISAGEVIENVSVPPAGGCVISVMVKLDNVSNVLAYPGFHQVFFYGDYKKELVQFCRLMKIEPLVA